MSRWFSAFVSLVLLMGLPVEAAPAKRKTKVPLKVLLERFQDNAGSYDPLSLRIMLKKISKQKINLKQWNEIRNYLMQNPQIGYDFIYKWELLRPQDSLPGEVESQWNGKIEKADQLMMSENFEEAFKAYQEVALFLKKEIQNGKIENLFLYTVMLHSMGRSLFGAGRYQEALTVYSWLPRSYPRLRQVLFEKMWTAFRLGRVDIALGAIASQESSYFSAYLEPESYLIKTYIFKKLCRDDDLKDLRKTILQLKNRIEKGDKTFFNEWASSDIEVLSLSRLTLLEPTADVSKDVSKADRIKEIEAINSILKKKFEIDIERLRRDLANILAYSNIALGSKDFTFVKHEEIDHTDLMAKGDEVWAVNDAEDWVDEIGGHLFIGDSLCRPEKKSEARQ